MRKHLLLSAALGSLIWASEANAVVIAVTDPPPLATSAMLGDIAVGSSNFSDHGILADSPALPELTTWVMVIAGFACLGYAAFRRNLKDRADITG